MRPQQLTAAPGMFLAKRILEEAERRSVQFTPGERRYLLLAGGTDTAAADEALEQLDNSDGFDPEDFDDRVSRLVGYAYETDLAADPAAVEQYAAAFLALTELEAAPQIWTFWAPLMFRPPVEKPASLWIKLGAAIALLVVVARAAVDVWELLRWHFLLRGGALAYAMVAVGLVLLVGVKERKLRTAAVLFVIANAAGALLQRFGASAAFIHDAAPAIVFSDLLAMVLVAETAGKWLKENAIASKIQAAND